MHVYICIPFAGRNNSNYDTFRYISAHYVNLIFSDRKNEVQQDISK